MPSLKELAERWRIPYRTLVGWVEAGIIEPEHRAGKQGVDIVLSDKNIVELENLIRLRKAGLSLQRARGLMEDLRAAGYNPLSRGIFVVVEKRKGRVVRISQDKARAREVAGPYKGQYVLVELLREEVERSQRPQRHAARREGRR